MQDGAVTTTFTANNGLCIPAGSKNIDKTMKFPDWMFADSGNNDLFELGIEGTDWKAVGDDQYQALTTYPDSFHGYAFTWNPNYVRFSNMLPADALKYRVWELKESSFQAAPVSGFNFDTSDVELSTTIAQVNAVTGRVATIKLHGILSDGTREYASAKEMLKENTDEAMKNGGEEIFKALKTQLDDYLSKNVQK